MSEITFQLNGSQTTVPVTSPTQTLLDFLRIDKGLCGTKEGCNEGDCGACTVMIADENGTRALNACILFMPQLDGKAVVTVEGLAGPDNTPHPVQAEMVTHHGSQCGFCTPGFVMSMATAHENDAKDFDNQLAGNLCRCTGYAPIIKAAEAAANAPRPEWMADLIAPPSLPSKRASEAVRIAQPSSAAKLGQWYLENPEATLIAGATDVGLWITKRMMTLDTVAFLGGIKDMKAIEYDDDGMHIGAGVSVSDFLTAIKPLHPDFGEMLRRFGSTQVRNAATIGGNIANGSPIGDSPPALIALNAKLRLQKGDEQRTIALEDFFISYGKQDRQVGEFVRGITIPKQVDRLKAYKISKRFDQDISALCGCFNIIVNDGKVTDARIAFGGMAATPKRASNVESTLLNAPWNEETVREAMEKFALDFTPLTDMRASAEYRLDTAKNLLLRYFYEDTGVNTRLLSVTP